MQRVHFIAIGGSVMHQLAISLKLKGYEVSGSDDEIFEPAKSNLQQHHLLPEKEGWFPEKIDQNLDAIILGMHAKADNPELAKAQQLHLKMYSFPEYIFNESKNKNRVVVGGSHGKTTTTSMIMHLLKQANIAFDYMVGAKLEGFDQSVKISHANTIVCEGDEYPASTLEKRPKFHFLYPHIAILTGIAWDHINVFPTYEIYKEQFKIFINKIESNGVLIYNITDKELVTLVEESRRPDIRYLPYDVLPHKIENGVTSILHDGSYYPIEIFGDHNLLNLHAALLVANLLGIKMNNGLQYISNFKGAAKRLEKIFIHQQSIVFRDFAHAPSKLKATFEAVKLQYPSHKIYAVFELHTFSSLNKDFLNEYYNSMNGADISIVYFSKHALELKRLPMLDEAEIKREFNNPNLVVIHQRNELERCLLQLNNHQAVYIFMSSGNYDGLDIPTFAKTLFTKPQ